MALAAATPLEAIHMALPAKVVSEEATPIPTDRVILVQETLATAPAIPAVIHTALQAKVVLEEATTTLTDQVTLALVIPATDLQINKMTPTVAPATLVQATRMTPPLASSWRRLEVSSSTRD